MEEMTIVKKAWDVRDPTIWDLPYNGPEDNWETVFAASSGQAKYLCRDSDKFINIQVRRNRGADIVLYNNAEFRRSDITERIESEKKKQERISLVMRFDEHEMFFIQAQGFVGNSMLWWGLNSSGYTTNIMLAHKYSRAEALARFTSGRDQDKIWPVSHIEKCVKQHVDAQYVDYDYVS